MSVDSLSILIVDDEQGIVECLSDYLSLDGHKIYTASGAYDAIDILKDNDIDLLMTDMKMPKGTGIELLRSILHQKLPPTSIIVMSGFTEVSQEELVALGATLILGKPIDYDILDKEISRLIESLV